ncbi:MAG TPA: EutN/CcmL family microcompartment protein [Candidatus Ozemobacteraceae bacterium]|nr:EutN/CcmL family microcompartment protein [Candidatus Ozemobacteraceae bacterium]
MQIGRVVKKVVSTVKNRVFEARPLLLVQPVDMALKPHGSEVLCIDFIGSDIDELVLIMKEGSSVQQMLGNKDAAADAAIIGVVDTVHLHDTCVFDKTTEATR